MLHKIRHTFDGIRRANGFGEYLNGLHSSEGHHGPTAEEAKRDYYNTLRASQDWGKF